MGDVPDLDVTAGHAVTGQTTDEGPDAGRAPSRVRLRRPAWTWTLTTLGREGRYRALEVCGAGGLVAAVAHDPPDGEAVFGLFPIERAPELVLRAAGLGSSDSRRLTEDVVDLDLGVRRCRDPEAPLPASALLTALVQRLGSTVTDG